MIAAHRLSEIGSTHGLTGRLPRDARPSPTPVVVPGVPTRSPRIPAADQRQEGKPAHPAAASSDLGLAMQPFQWAQSALLTQYAYAVETVKPVLRVCDESGQSLVVMMGPGAVFTARQAKALHVAIPHVVALGQLAERLAQFPELLTVLQHLERGDSVRIVVTGNSAATVTEFVGGDGVALTARVA